MSGFAGAAEVVQRGVDERAFPAAVVEVGTAGGLLWSQAFGRLDAEAESAPTQQGTIFDLASLTKVIATTTLVMRLVERGALALDDPIRKWIREWRGNDREEVTVRALLTHSSGLSAWLPFFRDYTGRQEFQHAIATLKLEYRPDSQSIYSDLGFMLLGFIVEDAGERAFASQAAEMLASLTSEPLMFKPPAALRSSIAPTGNDDAWRKRRLVGEVHDENCWALGGAAGHAGLFGSAKGVGDFARAVLGALAGRDARLARAETVRLFVDSLFGCYWIARSWMGHDVTGVFVRDEDIAGRVRSHRIHRHLVVDRSGAGAVRGVSHESCESDAREHGHPADPSGAARCSANGPRVRVNRAKARLAEA